MNTCKPYLFVLRVIAFAMICLSASACSKADAARGVFGPRRYVAASSGPAIVNTTVCLLSDGGVGLTTRTCTIPSTTAGDFLGVTTTTGADITAMTDGGDTFTSQVTNNGLGFLSIWTAPTAGSKTGVVIVEGGTVYDGQPWNIVVWEFSGLAGTIDNTANPLAYGSVARAGSATANQAGVYIGGVGSTSFTNGTFVGGGSWIEASNTKSGPYGAWYGAASFVPTVASTSYNASWNITPDDTGAGVALTVY